MKKVSVLGVALVLIMGLSFAGCDACSENILTKLGDTIATIGKDGMEKDKVLAGRMANRGAKCAEQKAAEMKKKMGF